MVPVPGDVVGAAIQEGVLLSFPQQSDDRKGGRGEDVTEIFLICLGIVRAFFNVIFAILVAEESQFQPLQEPLGAFGFVLFDELKGGPVEDVGLSPVILRSDDPPEALFSR